MSSTLPIKISAKEWAEIIEVREVQEAWGISDETAEEFSHMVYGAKYDFITGSPGYAGELFTLMGDGLSAPPMVLIRDENKKLYMADL